jgi:glycogen synthase
MKNHFCLSDIFKFKKSFSEAAEEYRNDHPMDYPRGGAGTCPICGHNQCFGQLADEDDRWTCFSTDHPEGAGKEGNNCFHGDILDIHAWKKGITPRELLQKEGYFDDD